MPSPPLANSPGNLSPNSLSPRSLSPNGNSPKHNIRPSACYSQPPNPQHQAAESRGKRGRGGGEGASGLPNPFSEFAPSPVSSPSTLSPCSSNSLPSSQAGQSWLFWPAPSWRIMRRNANSFQIPRNFFIKLFSYCFTKRIWSRPAFELGSQHIKLNIFSFSKGRSRMKRKRCRYGG